MAGWFDPDPTSPVVHFEQDDGSRVPIPRDRAAMFGFMPPSVADTVAQAVPEAPQPEEVTPPPPVAPGFAAMRPALPEGGASAFGQGALAPGVKAPQPELPQFQAPQPDKAPVVDAVSGGEPEMRREAPHGSMPGIGYVPAHAANPANWNLPPPDPTMESIDQESADRRVANLGRAEVEAENFAAQDERERAEEARELAKRSAEWETAVNKAANYKIDPGRKWADMGTGRKIGAIIMAAISGLGSALKGQGDRNPALDIIQAAIDEDIALQMDERGQLDTVADRKRGVLDDLRGVFKSREAERLARSSAIWKRLEIQSLKDEAAAGSQRVKLTHAGIAAEARARHEENLRAAQIEEIKFGVDIDQKIAQTEETRAKTDVLRRKAMGGGGGASATFDIAGGATGGFASIDDIKSPADKKRAIRLPDGRDGTPGQWVLTKSEAGAKIVDETLIKNKALVDMADEYLGNLAKDVPGFWGKVVSKKWTPADVAVIDSHNAQFGLKLAKAFDQGAISGGDRASYEKIIPDPRTLDANSVGAIRNLRSNTVRDTSTVLRQYGVDMDSASIFGPGPQEAKVKVGKEILEEGASVPRASDGAPAVDKSGKVLVDGPEAQRDRVDLFIDDAKRRYVGSGNVTAGIGEKKFRDEIKSGDGGLKTTNADMAELASNIQKWTTEIAKLKGKGATEKAAELGDKLRRAGEALISLRARRDALQKAFDESTERETRKGQAAKKADADAERAGQRARYEVVK